MAERPATRSTALALADERALMRQGYQFLDEKRMLLAAEMLRRLDAHRALDAAFVASLQAAAAALRTALQRHGRAGLRAQPAATAPAAPALARTVFLGLPLLAVAADAAPTGSLAEAVDPSPESRACAAAFAALLTPLAALGASAGNLERLGVEYRRTERRARALENVLLPEIEQALKAIDEHLALADQEEAVRIRRAGRPDRGLA
jgi:V/A-type H+/Na+-transporting ATPase subunit D